MPDYIDIHSHLNFPQFDEDREAAIQRMLDAKTWTITVGTDMEMSRKAIELAEAHEGMFACVGMHPTHNDPEFSKEKLIELAKNSKKAVAIGECGLDYFRIDGGDESAKSSRDGSVARPDGSREKKRQREVFETHIQAAIELDLPLMIHARAAYDEVHEILFSYSQEYENRLRANMHFFAGSLDDARKFLELGFTLSFDGPITFASSYDDIIRFAPLDRIMAETDAPFAAPAPWRGKRNEPSYVQVIAGRIAEIRGEDRETVEKALVGNALRVFKLNSPAIAA